MPRFEGPYYVTAINEKKSLVTVNVKNKAITFHSSQVRPFIENDANLFPGRANPEPGPIETKDGTWEHRVARIIDRKRRGKGWRYLVEWEGYGPEHSEWLPGRMVNDLEALDVFLRKIGEAA
jgi:hypothetical protein